MDWRLFDSRESILKAILSITATIAASGIVHLGLLLASTMSLVIRIIASDHISSVAVVESRSRARWRRCEIAVQIARLAVIISSTTEPTSRAVNIPTFFYIFTMGLARYHMGGHLRIVIRSQIELLARVALTLALAMRGYSTFVASRGTEEHYWSRAMWVSMLIVVLLDGVTPAEVEVPTGEEDTSSAEWSADEYKRAPFIVRDVELPETEDGGSSPEFLAEKREQEQGEVTLPQE